MDIYIYKKIWRKEKKRGGLLKYIYKIRRAPGEKFEAVIYIF